MMPGIGEPPERQAGRGSRRVGSDHCVTRSPDARICTMDGKIILG